MALEPFQLATVEAVKAAMRAKGGSRRFLIADEVGLGKTVVSRALAEHLGSDRRGPLNVVYLCSNLTIADQNRKKLTSLDQSWKAPEDRLSLLFMSEHPKKEAGFRVYSFTPDTSLPGWKRGNRTGRAAERDLIADLLSASAPSVLVKLNELERRRLAARKASGKPSSLWSASRQKREHLESDFSAALRDVFALKGKPLERGIIAWLEKHKDPLEFVLRARSALSLAALRNRAARPDLLILDEFHRYADLILKAEQRTGTELELERRKVHQLLVAELIGADRPIILLSATPYRLSKANGGAIAGTRYDHLKSLIRFLYADDRSAAGLATDRLDRYHTALQNDRDRGDALADVRLRKTELERSLRSVMSRTERATSLPGELFKKDTLRPTLRQDDLQVFKHFASVAHEHTPRMHSWVQPLWASIPYPAETMFGYVTARGLSGSRPPVTSKAQKNGPAHPLLRSLELSPGKDELGVDRPPLIDGQVLRLPWLPPSQPWWRLSGAWASLTERRPGKALLFSRYTGTPPAVSALISQGVTPVVLRGGPRRAAPRGLLRLDVETPGPLISLFLPWPNLSAAVHTRRFAGQTIVAARNQARKSFRAWAGDRGLKVEEAAKSSRKVWQLAFGIERHLTGEPALARLVRDIGPLKAAYSLIKPKIPPISSISGGEANALADFLLSAPGAVVARSVTRHDGEVFARPKGRQRLTSFCWEHLRPYLAVRHFADTLGRSKGRAGARRAYSDLLRDAVLEGGLEAVLDEHLAIMSLIGDGEVTDHLASCLVSAGHVRMRRWRGGAQQTPVHVAMPFNGAKRRNNSRSGRGGSSEHRSDTIRGAFNSPFWPHVLCTTSVGQEGLDFHVWCDRVIHWDLPRDPVDFEQREGRIARYGSLCVRRTLVSDFNTAGQLASQRASPFAAIIEEAKRFPKDDIGLARWWCPPVDKPRRVTFVTPFSLGGARLTALQDDLMRYRLGLGQPDPEQFSQFVKHFDLDQNEIRSLALDLSAWSHARASVG